MSLDPGTGQPHMKGVEPGSGSQEGNNKRMQHQAITLTDRATARVRALIDKRGQPAAGIRIGVKSKGCSGLSYQVDYADERGKFDEVIEVDGVRIFIDPTAIMFVIGSEMDYVEDKLQSGFVFRNPNEKGRCGCGESFHV
jgi:iron-sulfur cluster assembly protein